MWRIFCWRCRTGAALLEQPRESLERPTLLEAVVEDEQIRDARERHDQRVGFVGHVRAVYLLVAPREAECRMQNAECRIRSGAILHSAFRARSLPGARPSGSAGRKPQ